MLYIGKTKLVNCSLTVLLKINLNFRYKSYDLSHRLTLLMKSITFLQVE